MYPHGTWTASPQHLRRAPVEVTQVPPVVRRGEAAFLEDLARALRVWREQPALPATTSVFALLTALASSDVAGGALTGLAGLVAFVFLGYVGSERLWYLHAFTGRRLSTRAALRAALSYWPRFVRLGLLVSLVSLPLYVVIAPALIDAGRDASNGGTGDVPLWVLLYIAATSLLVDFALTFVTPALVYNTRRARVAARIGLRLLRRTWPHAAVYVLIPPFAVLLMTRFSSGPVGWGGVALIVGSTLLNLLAKGATAAYYLRIMPISGTDGDIDA